MNMPSEYNQRVLNLTDSEYKTLVNEYEAYVTDYSIGILTANLLNTYASEKTQVTDDLHILIVSFYVSIFKNKLKTYIF